MICWKLLTVRVATVAEARSSSSDSSSASAEGDVGFGGLDEEACFGFVGCGGALEELEVLVSFGLAWSWAVLRFLGCWSVSSFRS